MTRQTQLNSRVRLSNALRRGVLFISCGLVLGFLHTGPAYAQGSGFDPITVNGDKVEYSADTKEIIAEGHVEVIYKGAKLTCDKLTVNSVTKEAVAQGNARLEDPKGIIEGPKIIYNFQTRTGTIVEARFRANPYFITTKRIEKREGDEFVTIGSKATTCNLDHPHYHIGARKISIIPKDKIQMQEGVFYVGKTPIIYLPRYNHSLKDPFMHVQVTPGKTKDWGPFMLSAWRANLADNVNGLFFLDYRQKLGWAEGFGSNYFTDNFGKGDFKIYYTNEQPNNTSDNGPGSFDRFLTRWRHRWDIGQRTTFMTEFYKISDEKRKKLDASSNMLKDYFYREYERDSQPLSYALFHHNFDYSSVDLLFQKRTNHWYDQLEKLPELKYSLPSLRIGGTPFYFEDGTSVATYNKKASMSPVTPDDETMSRFDTFNKFSLPFRMAFLEFSPYVGERMTVYDKGLNGESLPVRTAFYSGIDASTKFYRTYDLRSKFLGMEIDGLRHIITPSIGYAYNHSPSVSASELKQIDDLDALKNNNAVTMALSNKLQTKRDGKNVDLLDARVETEYLFNQKPGVQPGDIKTGDSLSDVFFKLKFLPFSWLRLDGDATFNRSVSRADPNFNKFSTANYDMNFDLGKDRSFGFGQRYERGGPDQLTANLTWRLTPKWKFSMYNRFNIGHESDTVEKGLLEQQFTFTRDLHCWEMDVTLSNKSNGGSGIYFIFRLKAFPEMQFGFNQSYNSSKSGSQQN